MKLFRVKMGSFWQFALHETGEQALQMLKDDYCLNDEDFKDYPQVIEYPIDKPSILPLDWQVERSLG